MGSTPTIDYDALAKQAGAISSGPAGGVDYDALAKAHGAIGSAPGYDEPDAPPEPSLWEKVKSALKPRKVESSKPTGEMPGSFEGHPENLEGYVKESAGEILGGAGDLAKGDLAQGGARILEGAATGLAPAAPLAAAAAPAAAAEGAVGAVAGQKVAKFLGKHLGLSEPQQRLFEDVFALLGGRRGIKTGEAFEGGVKAGLAEPAASAPAAAATAKAPAAAIAGEQLNLPGGPGPLFNQEIGAESSAPAAAAAEPARPRIRAGVQTPAEEAPAAAPEPAAQPQQLGTFNDKPTGDEFEEHQQMTAAERTQAQAQQDKYYQDHPEKRPKMDVAKRGPNKGRPRTYRVFHNGKWEERINYK